VSRFSGKRSVLDFEHPNRTPWPVTEIALIYFTFKMSGGLQNSAVCCGNEKKYCSRLESNSQSLSHSSNYTELPVFMLLVQHSSVSIAMGIGADSHSLIPSEGKKLFVYSTASRSAMKRNECPAQWMLAVIF
jgi:hypothetical protein